MNYEPARKNMSTNISSIPGDVFLCILSMLPMKSVMKLKCVCKAWHLLVNDFADFFVKRVKESYQDILTCHITKFNCTVELTISAVRNEGGIQNLMTLSLEVTPHNVYYIMETVNGLICVTNQEEFQVCNPLTGQIIDLPVTRYNPDLNADPNNYHRANYIYHAFGFGYNSSTKEYKVVKIYNLPSSDRDSARFEGVAVRFEVIVFTLGSDSSWRNINKGPSHPINGTAIYFHGALYWRVVLTGLQHFIISFNIENENFTTIHLPFLENKMLLNFGVLQGRLCFALIQPFEGESYEDIWILDCEPKRDIQIWVMVDNGDWIKKFVILSDEYLPYWTATVDLLTALPTKEKLLIQRQSFGQLKRLAYYDLKSKVNEDFEIFGDGYRGAKSISWALT